MIKGIIIRGFQAHKKRKIPFTQGVNTIVGSTDKGKSAIIRALRWVMKNDLKGIDFINWDSKEAKISIRVDKSTITRTRSKSNNLYSMDKEEYKAFGTDVPDAISEHLRVSDVNFQSQMDAPFWFGLSGPETSRRLNQIINLSVIDSSMSNIASKVRECQSVVTLTTSRLEEAKIKKKETEFAEEMDEELAVVEDLQDTALSYQNKVDLLLTAIDSIKDTRKQTKRHIGQYQDLLEIMEVAKIYRKYHVEANNLENLIDDATEIKSKIKEVPDFEPVHEAREGWKDAHKPVKSLTTMITELEEAVEERDEAVSVFKKAESKFHKEIEGKECPLCGQTM